mmetsp:Transcript_182485/g.578319  ORF Transcript_182485/g.578319 Transcript_182485/m.578319 type:complete len:298 (+) Transcript_182485:399-1292(+)
MWNQRKNGVEQIAVPLLVIIRVIVSAGQELNNRAMHLSERPQAFQIWADSGGAKPTRMPSPTESQQVLGSLRRVHSRTGFQMRRRRHCDPMQQLVRIVCEPSIAKIEVDEHKVFAIIGQPIRFRAAALSTVAVAPHQVWLRGRARRQATEEARSLLCEHTHKGKRCRGFGDCLRSLVVRAADVRAAELSHILWALRHLCGCLRPGTESWARSMGCAARTPHCCVQAFGLGVASPPIVLQVVVVAALHEPELHIRGCLDLLLGRRPGALPERRQRLTDGRRPMRGRPHSVLVHGICSF